MTYDQIEMVGNAVETIAIYAGCMYSDVLLVLNGSILNPEECDEILSYLHTEPAPCWE